MNFSIILSCWKAKKTKQTKTKNKTTKVKGHFQNYSSKITLTLPNSWKPKVSHLFTLTNIKTETWCLRSPAPFPRVSVFEAWSGEANGTDQTLGTQWPPNKGTMFCWSPLHLSIILQLLIHPAADDQLGAQWHLRWPEQSRCLWLYTGNKTHLTHLRES